MEIWIKALVFFLANRASAITLNRVVGAVMILTSIAVLAVKGF